MNNAKTADAIFREARVQKNRANKYLNGNMFAQILGISGYSEQARVSGFPTKIIVQHPFLSTNAWIRGLPEVGTPVSVQYNPETDEAVHNGYRQLDPQEALKNGAEGNSLYIELVPGEIDVLSTGLAHSFKASRPVDVREAGLVRSTLDGDTSCFVNKAVTYIDILHQNEVATIKDTRRFGVVRRPETSVETRIVRAPESELGGGGGLLGAVKSAVLGDKPGFAKEMTTVLVSKERTLLDYREGHVIEDDGTYPVNSWTGNNLRVRKQVFNTEDEETSLEIDNLGNIDISVPDKADKGIRVTITSGSLDFKAGDEISMISTNNSLYKADGFSTMTVESGYYVKKVDNTIKITSGGDSTIQAEKLSTMSIGGFLTSLGQDGKASHPLLFGDDFIQAFMQLLVQLATHVHPGISVPSPDLANACIQLATKCPSFVSRNVQTQ